MSTGPVTVKSGPRMPSSFHYRLALGCLPILLFLITQVHPQCYRPPPRSPGHVSLTCCMAVSNATIKQQVDDCFEQKETTFASCKIHAYILAKGNDSWCVDPKAWWLQKRLQREEYVAKSFDGPNQPQESKCILQILTLFLSTYLFFF